MESSRDSAPGRAAFGLLALGLLLLTPLVFYRGFSDQFTYLKLVLTKGFVLFGTVGFALSHVWSRRRWPGDFRLAAPVALLTLAVWLSCLASPLPAFSLVEAEYFLCGPLWLLLMICWGGGEATVRWLSALVAVAGTVVAAIALLQWAGHDPLLFGGYRVEWGTMRASMRLYSTFGNPNLVAGYLIGAIFLALALAASAETPAVKFLSVAAVLVIFGAIIGTRSRGRGWGWRQGFSWRGGFGREGRRKTPRLVPRRRRECSMPALCLGDCCCCCRASLSRRADCSRISKDVCICGAPLGRCLPSIRSSAAAGGCSSSGFSIYRRSF